MRLPFKYSVEKVAENLTKARRSRKMTQMKLAELVGCDKKLISYFECGRQTPKLHALIEICQVLNYPIDEMVSSDKLDYLNCFLDYVVKTPVSSIALGQQG